MRSPDGTGLRLSGEATRRFDLEANGKITCEGADDRRKRRARTPVRPTDEEGHDGWCAGSFIHVEISQDVDKIILSTST